jgi:hypothetical protein
MQLTQKQQLGIISQHLASPPVQVMQIAFADVVAARCRLAVRLLPTTSFNLQATIHKSGKGLTVDPKRVVISSKPSGRSPMNSRGDGFAENQPRI